eukprot:7623236-Alexandrium_andersonii.AAC.1
MRLLKQSSACSVFSKPATRNVGHESSSSMSTGPRGRPWAAEAALPPTALPSPSSSLSRQGLLLMSNTSSEPGDDCSGSGASKRAFLKDLGGCRLMMKLPTHWQSSAVDWNKHA